MSAYRPDKELYNSRGKVISKLRYRTLDDVRHAIRWSIDTPKRGRQSVAGSAKWSGTDNLPQYVDMLDNGWDAGVTDKEGLEGLSADRTEQLTFVRNVGGVFPVVPAAIMGAPDAMLDVRPEPVDRVRGLTLVIDSCFYGGIEGETVLNYAKAVMRLIAWLQAERIETSVYIVCPIDFDGTRYVYVTPVRETGQILQPERLAAFVHPSWLRRAWFATIEYEHNVLALPGTGACRGGYGQVQNVSADEMRQCVPEAYSIIMLPKVGSGEPDQAVREAINLKLKQES